jgi:macrodomain Ter protein organizer (MatP/YcbG family)
MSPTTKLPVTVNMSYSSLKALQAYARLHGMTVSEFVEKLISDHLASLTKTQP